MANLFKQKTPKAPAIAAPKPPTPPAPTRMPTLMDNSVQEQKRLELQRARMRRGRASTVNVDRNASNTIVGSSGQTLGA